MKIYMLRLKNYPDKYVGKLRPQSQVATDKFIEAHSELDNFDVFLSKLENPLVPKKRAKIWTDEGDLRKFLSRCSHVVPQTFTYPHGHVITHLGYGSSCIGELSNYELLCIEGDKEEVLSLASFIPKKVKSDKED